VKNDLGTAKEKGEAALQEFVAERISSQEKGFFDVLPKM
jgi:hypothetical protein